MLSIMELFSPRRRRTLSGPLVVSILNLTPDSSVPESRVQSDEEVLLKATTALSDGADILELGGESTGPGSGDVSIGEELVRVIPALKLLRARFPDVWIAIDTWKSEVADAALRAGADVINDVTAGRADPKLLQVVADAGASVVLMYAKDVTPRTTVQDRRYDDVVSVVRTFLEERMRAAERAGIDRSHIIVDPGLGHFISSDPAYSYELLDHLDAFTSLAPVLVSPSRKSFLAGPTNLPPSERLPPTIAATALALLRGASIIRTHDTGPTKRAIDALRVLLRPS